MMQRKKNILPTIALLISVTSYSYGQTLIDFSVGSSNADYVFGIVAYRTQISERFRLGMEAQIGSVRYRFIEAKPIREGYSTMISIPTLYKLYETDHIRLDLYTRLGIRFQGIIDPDENDVRDETLSSTALHIEPGLVMSVPLSKKWTLQSGITLPCTFELEPQSIFENNTSAITTGFAYKASENKILILKALAGSSAGADGDSQKFSWSVQVGLRFLLGKKINLSSLVLEPSF